VILVHGNVAVVAVARDALAEGHGGGWTATVVSDTLPTRDVEAAEAAARHVAWPGVVAVVGPQGSGAALAAAPVYNRSEMPQVIPTATNPRLGGMGAWTFLMVPDDSLQGAALARFAVRRLGASRVSLFYVNEPYGTGLRSGLVREFANLNATVLDQVPYLPGSDIPLRVRASLARAFPDVIIVAGRQQATGTIARVAQEEAPGMRVLAGDGAFMLPTLADAAGPAADSIYFSAFWFPSDTDAGSRAFVARFRRITGQSPTTKDALYYDAIMILAAAVREGGANRNYIRRYLRELGGVRPAYQGVTGAVTFQPGRLRPIVFGRLDAGRVRQVPGP